MRIMACNGRIINVFPGCIPKVGSRVCYGFMIANWTGCKERQNRWDLF